MFPTKDDAPATHRILTRMRTSNPRARLRSIHETLTPRMPPDTRARASSAYAGLFCQVHQRGWRRPCARDQARRQGDHRGMRGVRVL